MKMEILPPEDEAAAKISKLHTEILDHAKQALFKAIQIGELLEAQKAALAHGQFTPWITKNLPFTDRTARNYMRCYRHRDELKRKAVSDLKAAYEALGVLTQPEVIEVKPQPQLVDDRPAEEVLEIYDFKKHYAHLFEPKMYKDFEEVKRVMALKPAYEGAEHYFEYDRIYKMDKILEQWLEHPGCTSRMIFTLVADRKYLPVDDYKQAVAMRITAEGYWLESRRHWDELYELTKKVRRDGDFAKHKDRLLKRGEEAEERMETEGDYSRDNVIYQKILERWRAHEKASDMMGHYGHKYAAIVGKYHEIVDHTKPKQKRKLVGHV